MKPTIIYNDDTLTWADVHEASLVPMRWYKLTDSEPMRYTGGAIVNADCVMAQFEMPIPGSEPRTATLVATPENPFKEMPAPVTATGNKKGSEKRDKEVLIAARVTADERDAIKARATQAGLTVSELIRQALDMD